MPPRLPWRSSGRSTFIAVVAVVLAFAAVRVRAQAPAPHVGRVIGIYDDATGQPLAGVEVKDLETGTKTMTSESGAATLAFLRPGTSLLQLRKLGYAGKLQPVVSSATDTASITVLLVPIAPTLPAVVTRGRSSGDTVRKLDQAGFYDRKRTTGAPESAFVTAEQFERWNLALLTDVKAHTGRGFTDCDLVYVDGVALTTDRQLNGGSIAKQRGPIGFLKRGIDTVVRPGDILGLEMYRVGDAPALYNRTRPRGCPVDSNVILIWLK
jgi:hypothetical protein